MKMNKPTRLVALLFLCLAIASCATSNSSLIDTGKAGTVAADDVNATLIKAAERGDTATIKVLVSAGADVNAQDNVGWTALMRAAEEGHADTVKMLLDAGANANAQDSLGYTALIWAIDEGHTDTAKVLIDAGRT